MLPTLESRLGTDMHLRFQVPAVALPLELERARLVVRIAAPSRRVTIAARPNADERLVELHRVETPLDPIRIDIARELLRLDMDGGLHLNLSVSDSLKGEGGKWTIERLELEVSGQTPH